MIKDSKGRVMSTLRMTFDPNGKSEFHCAMAHALMYSAKAILETGLCDKDQEAQVVGDLIALGVDVEITPIPQN